MSHWQRHPGEASAAPSSVRALIQHRPPRIAWHSSTVVGAGRAGCGGVCERGRAGGFCKCFCRGAARQGQTAAAAAAAVVVVEVVVVARRVQLLAPGGRRAVLALVACRAGESCVALPGLMVRGGAEQRAAGLRHLDPSLPHTKPQTPGPRPETLIPDAESETRHP